MEADRTYPCPECYSPGACGRLGCLIEAQRGLPHDPDAPANRIAHLSKRSPGTWRCDGCGALYVSDSQMSGGTWRQGVRGPEHRCPDLHPQAGHCSATWMHEALRDAKEDDDGQD